MPEHPHVDLLDPTFRVRLGPAPCALDLGDGSERGEYVPQDYILRLLGRPHRGINLMYCYYPYDKGWPKRASEAFKPDKPFAWAYPYDDYFPYQGGPKGTTDGEPFRQMKDVRRHGQDVTLTLAMDCAVKSDHLERIAEELLPFGRMRIRINHECDGTWFAYSKRYTHKEIADFFIRFAKILRKRAPEVQTICCWGSVDDQGNLRHPDLAPMLEHAHIWSLDKYLSLHYAWPFNVCEKEELNEKFTAAGVRGVYHDMVAVYEAFVRASGEKKPLEICEFNADGDVAGRVRQAEMLRQFYRKVAQEKPRFLKGITYYQFRDRGRLGLEQEDPNCRDVGIPAAFLEPYRDLLLHERHFSPTEAWSPLSRSARRTMTWRSAHDAEGLGWKVRIPKNLSFFELLWPKEANLLVRVGDAWFYKRPGIEWIDATEAARAAGPTVRVTAFAPPAEGTNPRRGRGYASDTQTRLEARPAVRIRGAWPI